MKSEKRWTFIIELILQIIPEYGYEIVDYASIFQSSLFLDDPLHNAGGKRSHAVLCVYMLPVHQYLVSEGTSQRHLCRW
jgi:hypothetical protein